MTQMQEASVIDLVAAQAAEHPRTTAVLDRLRRLSYAQLVRDANRLAHHLATKPVAPGDVVAIALEPSCDLAVTLLAIWKTGAIALPMDPGFPAARLGRMLGDAGCRHVVTVSAHAQTFRSLGVIAVNLDAELPWIECQPNTAPSVPVHHLACLLYTSGSTGRPKGVAIPQRAIVNKLIHFGAWGIIDVHCRAAWHGSPAFDASLAQLLLPLAHGGCVRALDSQERLDRRLLWSAILAHRTTVLDCTPSWLLAMLDGAPPDLALDRIVLGGEILTPALARRIQARFPGARLVNVYGPTEACIDATAHELNAADLAGDTIPIGRPLPGYGVQLLDEALHPVPNAEAGELYISGIGLADGYWNQPQATAERFVADPRQPTRRLYRTGDLARRRADGKLEFLGRVDQQIKLRGQRVELGEIEALLARQPGVTAGVVRTWPTPGSGDPMIVAYAMLSGTSADIVRERLRRELPSFMVPAVVVAVDALPILLTGKVDRDRLPAPTLPAAAPKAPVRTRDALERDLLALWNEMLGTTAAGAHDNFFELGGDSLRAVELTVRIGERFGIELPLAALLAHPTVADLALALLRGRRNADTNSRVLMLGGTAAGHAKPLFMLPPGSGVGLLYSGLARELAGIAPCHALQAVGLEGGPPGSYTMQAMVAQFVADVERLQPVGDVQLCGYSAGGPVAHEMARQLGCRARRVSRLFLIDPACPDHAERPDCAPPADADETFRNACRDMLWDALGLRGGAAEPVLLAAEGLRKHGVGRGAVHENAAARRALAQARRVLPPGTDVQMFLLLLEGVANYSGAIGQLRLDPLPSFDGEAWLVQPDGETPAQRQALRERWEFLVGKPLQVHVVPGEHATMLQRAATVDAIGALLCATMHPLQEAA